MDSIQNFFRRQYEKIRAWVQENPRRALLWLGGILLIILGFIFRADVPHVSLAAEPILAEGTGPQWLTNSLIHTLLVDLVLIVFAFIATRGMSIVPGGLQNFIEAVIEYLYGLCEGVAGRDASKYAPWAMTLFFLIIVSNWSGLIPGVGSIGINHVGAVHGEEQEGEGEHSLDMRSLAGQLAMSDGTILIAEPGAAAAVNAAAEEEGHAKFVPLLRPPSADLNATFAWGLATMVMVQIYGVRALGAKYFKKFWNLGGHGFLKWPLFFASVLEAVSEVARILTFAFRLFGNIFAGEVVLATMAFLVAFLVPLPFYGLELFVGFVQALVFMMLALAFFTMATISHDDHH